MPDVCLMDAIRFACIHPAAETQTQERAGGSKLHEATMIQSKGLPLVTSVKSGFFEKHKVDKRGEGDGVWWAKATRMKGSKD
jgi:hypothetical protein